MLALNIKKYCFFIKLDNDGINLLCVTGIRMDYGNL